MTALPTNRFPIPGMTNQPKFGDYLRRMSTAIGNYQNATQSADNLKHLEAVYSANPQFAQGLLGLRQGNMEMDLARAEQERIARRDSALAALAGRAAGGAPLDSVLGELAVATGDPSELIKYQVAMQKAQSPESGGATGVLVDRLMRENPGMTFSDALFQVQTGLRRGLEMQGGELAPRQGFGEALGTIGGLETAGKTQGELAVRQAMEPTLEAGKETAKQQATYMAQGKQKLPQVQRALQDAVDRDAALESKIDTVAERATALTTGWVGAIGSVVPGTPAYDLKRDIETLLANAGFDRLQEMRNNSPTGGALGSVTENELRLLQAAAQNLQNSQSKEQFLTNLAAFKEQRARSLSNIRTAYEQDYARFGGSEDVNLPSPQQTQAPVKKVRRYNPATGKVE